VPASDSRSRSGACGIAPAADVLDRRINLELEHDAVERSLRYAPYEIGLSTHSALWSELSVEAGGETPAPPEVPSPKGRREVCATVRTRLPPKAIAIGHCEPAGCNNIVPATATQLRIITTSRRARIDRKRQPPVIEGSRPVRRRHTA